MKRILYTLLLLSSMTAYSQNLLNESFSYGAVNDTLCGTGGLTTNWFGHSGTGTNPVMYSSVGLTYAGYNLGGAGGAITFANASGTREDINRPFTAVTSGSVYCSFLMNVTASGGTVGDYMVHLNDSQGSGISTTFRAKIFIKDSASGYKIALAKGGAVGVATWNNNTIYNLNQTYLVVLKYTFFSSTATDDSVYLYTFSSGVPATEPSIPTIANNDATSDLPRVRSICMRQGGTGTASMKVDEIRVGLTWANAPVPVKWSAFTATKTADASALRWSTASETNNSHFEVQRSTDGRNFEAIGRVKGTGNSSRTVNYSFTDREATTSRTTYYRLKQVDFDGKSEYSRTVSVNNATTKAGIGATLPNPFSSDVNITVNATVAASATVIIMDMIGKTHHTSTEQLLAGANTININTSDMPDGIYFVRVSYNGETFTQKIVKK
ncbi:MAG: T9SS type A sorting domain-containing protein [Bacteroidota bacterium]